MQIQLLFLSAYLFIFLQGTEAQDVTINDPTFYLYNGTDVRSARLVMHENGGAIVAAIIYLESKEGFEVQDGLTYCGEGPFCRYPAWVYINGIEQTPFNGYFEDNCVIKNDMHTESNYATGQTYKVFMDGGNRVLTFDLGSLTNFYVNTQSYSAFADGFGGYPSPAS